MIMCAGMNAKCLPLLFASASILLTACGSVVTDGGGSSGNPPVDNTTSGGNPSGGAPGEESLAAVALTRAQNDVLWEEYWASQNPTSGTTSSSGGGELDPNDLFLRLSDLGVSCGSPTVNLPCGGHYELSIVLPPAFQQVGVYDLEDPQLITYSSMSETGQLNSADPQDCPWGGGTLGGGTLEILSIDDAAVHFKVTLTNGIWEANPSGEYDAPRCPAAD